MKSSRVTIAGAGVIGLWQALTLARAGHRVRVLDAAPRPFVNAQSRWAGAMLAPDCEAESAPPVVRDLGRRSIALWQSVLPNIAVNGTLVVAAARDLPELHRFARATDRHQMLASDSIAALEPDLAGRFDAALFFANEAHFSAIEGLEALLAASAALGVEIAFNTPWDGTREAGELVIDCTGIAARRDLPGLRGVRGERVLLKARDVTFARPVRLLHPRQPIYVVPQGGALFVVGATVIEREDDGAMTVRSALELLGSAYALHPAFGEAEIVDFGAGVRPAFADNVPRIMSDANGDIMRVNGAYRHGFLLAPVLAEALAARLAGETAAHPLIV
ncbi:MAG: FAD-dependent oxidoreductase [Hyphomicrobium sp.]